MSRNSLEISIQDSLESDLVVLQCALLVMFADQEVGQSQMQLTGGVGGHLATQQLDGQLRQVTLGGDTEGRD